jgi:ABC-type oligopeptide transport system substrate-binding subunit
MKKYTFILAIGAVFALMSCGSGSTTSEANDTTAVAVDTTAVGATNPNVGEIPSEVGIEKPVTEEVN